MAAFATRRSWPRVRAVFDELPALFVAVRCPIEVIMERRKASTSALMRAPLVTGGLSGPVFGNVTRRMGWLGPRATLLPGDPGRRAGANRSSRWRGSKAVSAHDLAKPFDVRRALAAEHVGDIFEVARAH
jgi:hypothetical protein